MIDFEVGKGMILPIFSRTDEMVENRRVRDAFMIALGLYGQSAPRCIVRLHDHKGKLQIIWNPTLDRRGMSVFFAALVQAWDAVGENGADNELVELSNFNGGAEETESG